MNNNQMKSLVKDIDAKFYEWLHFCKLTEKEIIMLRQYDGFRIEKSDIQGIRYYLIAYGNDNSFGSPFGISLTSREAMEDGFYDFSFILYRIASILDQEDSKAPAFAKRPEYFVNYMKSFLNSEAIDLGLDFKI